MMQRKRGQAVITDLFISVSIFIILVTIITLTMDLYDIRLHAKLEYEDMVLKTFLSLDTLVKSRGIPTNWEFNASGVPVQEFGLAATERVIDPLKWDTLRTNYTDRVVKDMLKINPFEYRLTLRELNGTVIATKGTFPSGSTAVNLARIILYKNQPRIVELTLWK